MIVVGAVLGTIAGLVLVGVEVLRWTFRPEARRLRVLKKIRGRR